MILKLLANFAQEKSLLRPPGAVEEKEFQKKCIRCLKCVEVCPYHSIKVLHVESGSKMGTPVIRAREVPCYLCMKCLPVCPTGALQPIPVKEKVRMGVAKIDESTCFAYNGILCRACYERCPIYREAVTLEQEIYPVVNEDKCVGCGICEHVCLTAPPSITVKPGR